MGFVSIETVDDVAVDVEVADRESDATTVQVRQRTPLRSLEETLLKSIFGGEDLLDEFSVRLFALIASQGVLVARRKDFCYYVDVWDDKTRWSQRRSQGTELGREEGLYCVT